MVRAVIPGTFDPPTNGHLNIIRRAAMIFAELHVVIAVNNSKNCLFTARERLEMLTLLLKDCGNITISLWDKLIVDFVRLNGIQVIVRGVRALADFGYEFELAMTNKSLNNDIETIFLPTDPKYFVLRSSAIKEIAVLGGDISMMVPELVGQALLTKLGKEKS